MTAPGNTDGALPDIPGLTLEELRALILERTGLSVGKDDPIMAVHVLHGAMLRDYEAMIARHNAALTALFERSVATWSEGVNARISELSDQVLSDGLKERLAQLAEYARLTHEAEARMRQLARLIGLLSLFNILSVAVIGTALLVLLT